MKSKFLILSICFIVLFSVVFVSCVDTVNPDNVGGTTDSGNQGGGETDYTTDIEYADELALSYNRLENADLSFNFEITPAIAESANGLYNSSYVPDMAEDNGDGTTYTVKKEDFYNKFEDYVPEGYFDSEEQHLKSLSDMAKEIVDFVVDNITVLNRVVNYYSKSYYLGYDKENDVVTVCRQSKYSDSELVEIEKIIYKARSMNPDFPGLIDYTCWKLGKDICKSQKPKCSECLFNNDCPKYIDNNDF